MICYNYTIYIYIKKSFFYGKRFRDGKFSGSNHNKVVLKNFVHTKKKKTTRIFSRKSTQNSTMQIEQRT